jgi:hypothetical protein
LLLATARSLYRGILVSRRSGIPAANALTVPCDNLDR